jgi:hypothetical protein
VKVYVTLATQPSFKLRDVRCQAEWWRWQQWKGSVQAADCSWVEPSGRWEAGQQQTTKGEKSTAEFLKSVEVQGATDHDPVEAFERWCRRGDGWWQHTFPFNATSTAEKLLRQHRTAPSAYGRTNSCCNEVGKFVD